MKLVDFIEDFEDLEEQKLLLNGEEGDCDLSPLKFKSFQFPEAKKENFAILFEVKSPSIILL